VTAGIRSHARTRQRGQTLIVLALAFALFLFSLTCLVADSAFLYVWSGRVNAAAQLAAQSGADAVDPRYLYGQSQCAVPPPGGACAVVIVDINPDDRQGALFAFQRACIQAGDQSAQMPGDPAEPAILKTPDDLQDPDGTSCDSDGCQVFAVVSRAVHLPIPIPGFPDTVTVRGIAYAAPVVGTSVATAACTGGVWVPAPPH
jgi:hypothetical protein